MIILSIGSINLDNYMLLNSKSFFLGGSSLNTAYFLQNLLPKKKYKTFPVGLIGNDQFANQLKTKMETKKIPIELVFQSEGDSGSTKIVLDRRGERSIIRKSSVTSKLPNKIGDVLQRYNPNEISIHLKGSLDLLSEIIKYSKKIFSLDFSGITQSENKSEFKQLIEREKELINFRLLIGNVEEFNEFLEIFGIDDALRENEGIDAHLHTFQRLRTLINFDYLFIKRGKYGGSLYYKEKIINCKAPEFFAIDTTGAGDAFNAGAIYGILEYENQLDLVLKIAIELGSLNCLTYGGQEFCDFNGFKKKFKLQD